MGGGATSGWRRRKRWHRKGGGFMLIHLPLERSLLCDSRNITLIGFRGIFQYHVSVITYWRWMSLYNSVGCRIDRKDGEDKIGMNELTAGTRSFLISSVARWSLTRARFSVSSTVMRTCSSSLRCSQLGLPRFCSSCPFVSCHVQNQKNSSCRVHIVNHSNNYNDGNRLLQHSYQFLLLFINYYQ